uniref:5-oxoprolinase n=1 Tax=Caenorhabditis tropicalis TaxID=1561998 RepID=A0A1I7TQH1_9PELO
MSLGFAIDRGGTFTDVIVFKPNEEVEVLKVLSVDPSNYSDAPTEAIRQVLERETGKRIPRGEALPTDSISWIRMGTTVATNALLERKGERIGLLITKGFKDLLFIGNQSRPRIFDFNIKIPEVLYDDVIEVDERVLILEQTKELVGENVEIQKTINGMEIVVEKRVEEEELKEKLAVLKEKGIKSVAILFLHSFIYPAHEKQAGAIAKRFGFDYVSLSHEVMPMIKVVPRGFTVCADAYLTPKIMEYLEGFERGFNDLSSVRVNFMQSDGGLCEMKSFRGSRAILSGPAGGVVGIASTAYKESDKKPIIGFDMGGTSTDVCRYSGHLEHVMETTTAGITIQAPQLDIHTVAAGGGSRLFFRDGLLIVGPESASAHPGPVCYRKNGYLTVTDANLVVGRILPEYFPKIFGPNADQELDKEASYKAMEEITATINEFMENDPNSTNQKFTVEEVALGFLAVANEEMCRPIRTLTQSRGFNPSEHVLACFGGAGGQHACAVAKVLGISQVRIHKYASLLSAYGIALADVVDESQTPAQVVYEEANFPQLFSQFMDLRDTSIAGLKTQGFGEQQIETKYFMHMRYEKTDTAIMISWNIEKTEDLGGFLEEFRQTYRREFGFVLEDRNIIIDDVRIRTRGKAGYHVEKEIKKGASREATPRSTTQVYFENVKFVTTGVYLLEEMLAGQVIKGPALLIDKNSTIVIEPSSVAEITDHGNVELRIGNDVEKDLTTDVDPIRLAIFSNRFMSIAEQMGRILQRTAISTNIKERLDFSCALFAPDGGLIANAPHIPVHLGGMQYTVKFQIDHRGIENIKEGDVYLANHPLAGGCHLPDFTVITPVFLKGHRTPVFFVANRGHHADIGGLVPGSMPPNAHHIEQEGAAFISFKLVDEGVFQEEALIRALKAPGEVPGCSAARNIGDNIADLNAQIAANRKLEKDLKISMILSI